uniref:Uncharacterized protein n=1 Tax=Anguilla anguilla TaxID=7936 RepID=A0A0E9XY63_ANGAN
MHGAREPASTGSTAHLQPEFTCGGSQQKQSSCCASGRYKDLRQY